VVCRSLPGTRALSRPSTSRPSSTKSQSTFRRRPATPCVLRPFGPPDPDGRSVDRTCIRRFVRRRRPPPLLPREFSSYRASAGLDDVATIRCPDDDVSPRQPTNDRPGIPLQEAAHQQSPPTAPRTLGAGRSACHVTVHPALEPKPSRVRNIFHLRAVVFWLRSRMMNSRSMSFPACNDVTWAQRRPPRWRPPASIRQPLRRRYPAARHVVEGVRTAGKKVAAGRGRPWRSRRVSRTRAAPAPPPRLYHLLPCQHVRFTCLVLQGLHGQRPKKPQVLLPGTHAGSDPKVMNLVADGANVALLGGPRSSAGSVVRPRTPAVFMTTDGLLSGFQQSCSLWLPEVLAVDRVGRSRAPAPSPLKRRATLSPRSNLRPNNVISLAPCPPGIDRERRPPRRQTTIRPVLAPKQVSP